MWISSHWLAMSNCMYNPMVYCWMNSKYRNGFRYVLRFLPCVTYKEDTHGPYGVKRATTYVSTVRTSIYDKRSALSANIPSPKGLNNKDKVIYRGENIPLNGINHPVEVKGVWNKKNNKDYYGDPYSNYTERMPLQEDSDD